MATQNWKQNTLITNLLKDPMQFDFFQALRLLECSYYQNKLRFPDLLMTRNPFIKFSVFSKNRFPVSQIEALSKNLNKEGYPTFNLQVSFLGLTGICGALPSPYTEKLLIEMYQGNFLLRDFLDIFNHRALSLFYQAWKKNHFFVSYGFKMEASKKIDPFTNLLEQVSGLAPLTQQATFQPREISSFYASIWGRVLRSSVLLEHLLSEYFELPIKILPFQGKWLSLKEIERSKIASLNSQSGQYQQLGVNTILGHKKWCVQSKFLLYIGPLNYQSFEKLTPGGEWLKALKQMVNIYIPPELNFDIELELFAEEVPPCKIESNQNRRLGWNAWLSSQPFRQNGHAILQESGA